MNRLAKAAAKAKSGPGGPSATPPKAASAISTSVPKSQGLLAVPTASSNSGIRSSRADQRGRSPVKPEEQPIRTSTASVSTVVRASPARGYRSRTATSPAPPADGDSRGEAAKVLTKSKSEAAATLPAVPEAGQISIATTAEQRVARQALAVACEEHDEFEIRRSLVLAEEAGVPDYDLESARRMAAHIEEIKNPFLLDEALEEMGGMLLKISEQTIAPIERSSMEQLMELRKILSANCATIPSCASVAYVGSPALLQDERTKASLKQLISKVAKHGLQVTVGQPNEELASGTGALVADLAICDDTFQIILIAPGGPGAEKEARQFIGTGARPVFLVSGNDKARPLPEWFTNLATGSGGKQFDLTVESELGDAFMYVIGNVQRGL